MSHRPRARPPHAEHSPGSALAMGTFAVGLLLAAAVWPTQAPGQATAVPIAAAPQPQFRTGAPGLFAAAVQPQRPAAAIACRPLELRARVAQTILSGFPGTRMSEVLERLVTREVGSLLLLRTNVESREQLVRLTTQLDRMAPHRLLIAVDEEGGRVSRLGEEGVVDLIPSARSLAATASPDDVREIGTELGRQMRALGVDWNLAPVLDVTGAPDATVIGDRSYGADPETAGTYGRAFAEGLAAAGVLTTGKHFPGEGGTTMDPHETLPKLAVSRAVLEQRDLPPFRTALPALDAVMASHVVYSSLDPRLPAGLSPATAELLRADVGFGGLLMTDALEMDAITERWSIPEAAEMAIGAGVDVVLVGPWERVEDTARRLRRAVRTGRIDEARLDEAVARVLALKGYTGERIACLLA